MATSAASAASSSLVSPFALLTSAARASSPKPKPLIHHPSLLLRSLITKPLSPSNGIASKTPFLASTFRSIPLSTTRSPLRAASSSVTIEEKTIAVGDKLPEGELSYLDQEGQLRTIKVSELTEGKKVVLFAVPGAFTPTCSQKHVPGFVEKAEELKDKGVDTIACVSVNDVYVLKAWGESLGVGDKVLLLSDGGAEFTRALGVTLDLTGSPKFLSLRSRRYALLAEDGVVKVLNLEEGGSFTISSAEDILKAL